MVEEITARPRQGADRSIAVGLGEHCGGSAGGVIAQRILTLEQRYPVRACELGRRRRAGDAAADDENVRFAS